jgi:hypothetical protein
VILILVVLAGLWLFFDLTHRPPEPVDRGRAGIDFPAPQANVLDLGESTLPEAAKQLLRACDSSSKVGAVFVDRGDRIQLLVDLGADRIEEYKTGRTGTAWFVLWPESARERLAWAAEHGTLEAPGLPAPQRRNPYH